MNQTQDVAKYQSNNPLARYLLERFISRILDQIKPLPISSVLEAGCGEGYLLERIILGLDRPFIFRGFELKDDLAVRAQARLPSASIWVDSIYNSKCSDDSADLVLCTEVLEHLEDPPAALRELVRISSGYILLSVPDEPAFSLVSLLRGKYLSRLGRHPEHIQAWSASEFSELVGEYAQVISVNTSFPWTIVLARKK